MRLILGLLLSHLVLATSASLADSVQEKTWSGPDEAVLTVRSKQPKVTITTNNDGIVFRLDFATHGALSLANVCAHMRTEPKDFTLSFEPKASMVSVDYDKDKKEMRVFLHGSPGSPIGKLPLELSESRATRVLLRQRDQLALFAVPPDGSHVTLVWLGVVDYQIALRNAAQYELCRDLKITMGKRELSLEKLRDGIPFDTLDEAADVTVTGVSPAGESFAHRYTFDYAALDKLLERAYTHFLQFVRTGAADKKASAENSKPSAEPPPAASEPDSTDDPE